MHINYINIMCINNNNSVINNNGGRVQGLTLLFKKPIGTRKIFFENYGQFVHTA